MQESNLSLVILKPDAVQRRLVGQLIQRFENKGLKIAILKMIQMDKPLAAKHYAVHKDKEFFQALLDYITSGPVVVMVLEGPGVVKIVRNMLGPTDGAVAPAGTIRGDFACTMRYNLVHASDSQQAAADEIKLFFPAGELMDYQLDLAKWS